MRGKAIDVWSRSKYPANVLSNLCSNSFRFEGVVCVSMEGFLQSLKQKDSAVQRRICGMKGRNARKMTVNSWKTDQIVWWKGMAIDRQSDAYHDLISRAYRAMFDQNERFRAALMATRGMRIYHSRGESNPFNTILTEREFCDVLVDIRDSYDKRDKYVDGVKKRLFVDLNLLVDFSHAVENSDESVCKERENVFDIDSQRLPELFAVQEAMDATRRLNGYFDLYIISNVPWRNLSNLTYMRKLADVFGEECFCGRLVLADCKNVLKGNYMISKKDCRGVEAFEGELIEFGGDMFPDWDAVIAFLLRQVI